MIVYTIQLGQWRHARDRCVPLLDVTVKSGIKELAPTWELLQRYRSKQTTAEEYTVEFYTLMRESYRTDPMQWASILDTAEIALACYCKAGDFCHRHLLVDMIEKQALAKGIPFFRGGEIVNGDITLDIPGA